MHLLTVSFIISNYVYSSDNQISCNDATTVFSMVLDFFKDGLEKHGNGMEFYTGSSVRTLQQAKQLRQSAGHPITHCQSVT